MNLALAKGGKLFFVCLVIIIFLAGCAHSNVSRDAATNVDLGVRNAKNLLGGALNGDIAETYQNMNQTSKGAVIGGVTGGIVGSLSSGIGVGFGALTGAVLGASYGAYIDANTTLEDMLENRGAEIIILGDQILVVIPSARIFQPMTAIIKPQSYSTLTLLTQYINRFVKMTVKVAVYTTDTGAPPFDVALSKQQAASVAKFLLASGVDARLLYAVGCGGTNLVVRRELGWDSDNYRIEVMLEKLIV